MDYAKRIEALHIKLSKMGLKVDPTMDVDDFCNFYDELDSLLEQCLGALIKLSNEGKDLVLSKMAKCPPPKRRRRRKRRKPLLFLSIQKNLILGGCTMNYKERLKHIKEELLQMAKEAKPTLDLENVPLNEEDEIERDTIEDILINSLSYLEDFESILDSYNEEANI